MGVWEIIIITACIGVVLAVSVAAVIGKKKGKHSCSGCAGCPHAAASNRRSEGSKAKYDIFISPMSYY